MHGGAATIIIAIFGQFINQIYAVLASDLGCQHFRVGVARAVAKIAFLGNGATIFAGNCCRALALFFQSNPLTELVLAISKQHICPCLLPD